jgi:hypothetical protein
MIIVKNSINLRGIVLTWTILTSTFFWTSTMRLLLKPEISSWRIFTVGGKGLMGEFWLPPLVVFIALFLFYLEGRGKLRPIYHILLICWHLAITGLFIYGSMQSNARISFGTWGVRLDLIWLVVPLAVFSILAIILVIQESRGQSLVVQLKWYRVDWKTLAIAVMLFPVALLFFRLGEGFNWLVKIAVIVTIIQWILIAEALGRPNSK